MHTLIILEEADKELQEAAAWYEEKGSGLGFRFIEVIKRKFEIIQEHPERNSRRKGNFREAVVKIFPYVIVYTFYKENGVITVNSIFHTSQSPKKKHRKK